MRCEWRNSDGVLTRGTSRKGEGKSNFRSGHPSLIFMGMRMYLTPAGRQLPPLPSQHLARWIFLSILLLATAGPALAANEFQTHYVEAKKLLDCRVYLPEDFDSAREYPLVIALHGYGGSPDIMSGLWTYFDDHDFILALPEAPYAFPGNGVKSGTRFSWDFKGQARDLWQDADPWVYEYILRVAKDLSGEYPVSRTILLGHSQGVAYAYAAAFHSAGAIEGVICFAGRLPETNLYPWLLDEEALRSGSGLRVFIAHGKADPVVADEVSLAAAEKLRKNGCDVEVHLFEGGHVISRAALRRAFEWFGVSAR